jgi:hypothetical protein
VKTGIRHLMGDPKKTAQNFIRNPKKGLCFLHKLNRFEARFVQIRSRPMKKVLDGNAQKCSKRYLTY